ncbi:MAG TPA: alpha/beta fold hydrolase [Bryobacteraceae bacterium]|nr:alpha/beta fold hydrolase [Bryobacteraceae bacterium]
MKKPLAVAALSAVAICALRAQTITGDWLGTLHVGPAELRLVLHITAADAGFKGTMDSIDQPAANGTPLDSISLKDSKLTFAVAAVHGSYEGTVNADASAITGTWTQKQTFPLEFRRPPAGFKEMHKPAKPSEIDGAWMGTLDMKLIKLRVIFHLINTEDGLTATLDSPDQGAMGLPATSVARDGKSVTITLKQIAGEFTGELNPVLDAIEGSWTQAGNTTPLNLTRVKDAAALERKRPQTPARPYPYRSEDVTYENKSAGITLAATFTVPQGKGPFPAVVLITGSGPQDRDESLLGHKPFLVLADYLTRHGIAVLRADDRGTAKSGGDFTSATTADFASDAEAGVAWLKTRSEGDPQRIGLIGHSEGGIVAPMVAARNPDVAFIVLMAGPGVSLAQILVAQQRLILQASGMSKEEVDKKAEQQRAMLKLVREEKDNAALEKKMKQQFAGVVPDDQMGVQAKMIGSPWFRWLLDYDPAATLRKLTCPVLAINGEKDLQVPPQQNLPPIRTALEQGGNRDFEVDELPGLNHLFQTAKTGALSEYAEIEETISPVALDKISSWILKH